MLDLEDINLFNKYSMETFALVSGMAIIGTGAYLFYVIYPLFTGDKSAFFFSLLGLAMCALAPLMFYLSELTDISSIAGKFIAGVIIAGFATLLFQVTRERTLIFGQHYYPFIEILLTGVFSGITSFFLVRGVIVPILEKEEYETEDELELEEDEFLEEEDEYISKEAGTVDYSEDDSHDEDDKFIDEEDEPW